MASKGIEFYGFVADGFTLEVKAHGANDKNPLSTTFSPGKTWQHLHYEIETDWGGLYYEGRLQFIARRNGQQLFERSMRVNAITGSINDEDLRNLLVPAVITGDYCLSFGLYNSDAGIISGLPNGHQVWASLTPAQATWQDRLLRDYEQQRGSLEGVKFSQLALPGSHDAGMLLPVLPYPIADLANTQKDDTRHQLELGARYFDFRPGRIRPDWQSVVEHGSDQGPAKWLLEFIEKFGISALAQIIQPLASEIRHVHAIIPGFTYEEFLRTVVGFLQEHRRELVFVRLKSSGFLPGAVDTPASSELRGMLDRLLAGTGLQAGGPASLTKSVGKLLETGERLIICYGDEDVPTFSTYSDDYQSYDSQRIIDGLHKINGADLSSTSLVDAQLQLTASAETGAIARSILATEAATSPLAATKPRTDERSYRWLQDELHPKRNDVLLTICNDFYDNGLTQVAAAISRKRLGLG